MGTYRVFEFVLRRRLTKGLGFGVLDLMGFWYDIFLIDTQVGSQVGQTRFGDCVVSVLPGEGLLSETSGFHGLQYAHDLKVIDFSEFVFSGIFLFNGADTFVEKESPKSLSFLPFYVNHVYMS